MTPPATTGMETNTAALDVAAAAAALSLEASSSSSSSAATQSTEIVMDVDGEGAAVKKKVKTKTKKKKKKKKKNSYKAMMAAMMKPSQSPAERRAASDSHIAANLGGGEFTKFERL
tara:strand:+ start:261 stop:608 length:348 start_codon:yes stop_codon:yes gene_type:complete